MRDIIASRTLYTPVAGEVRSVTFLFLRPVQEQGHDWKCDCVIEGDAIAIPSPQAGWGVDGVQALLQALWSVGVALEESGVAFAISPEPFLTGQAPDERYLGHFFPRFIDIGCGMFDWMDRNQPELDRRRRAHEERLRTGKDGICSSGEAEGVPGP